MGKRKLIRPASSNNDMRRLMLQYFYDRNRNASSTLGKRGSAVKISDIKKELKERHGLTQQEVQSNLTYLISQGRVEEKNCRKANPRQRWNRYSLSNNILPDHCCWD